MIWFAVCIPLIISLVGYYLYKHKFAWWELFIPTGVALIAIVVSFYTMKSITLSDVEYNGYLIKEARYYEYYETWVTKTCSYTTCSGTGKTRTCTTHYYDCSYCDTNSAYWVMIDTHGNSISISQEKYLALMRKWKAIPKFVELDRDINYRGGCGKDGDMYSIKWDNHIQTSETSTYTNEFSNILKSNHSAFNFPVITPEDASKLGLYEYPIIGEYNKQNSVIGLSQMNIKGKNQLQTSMNYLNGSLGASNKVRVYTLFFVDKEIDIAFKQEAYWDGGNQNELVVCIGVDKIGNIKWCKPFTWCDNKRMIVDTREDIMNIKTVNNAKMYNIYKKNIMKFWKYKSFKDFNYLSFEPTTGQLIFVYVLTTIISLLLTIWCILNDTDSEDYSNF
jgi:hypothetical protein